ncbi:syncytin-1-like [Microtus oregoni]|uniref:syncytin-1-like n=1 Tax=Microtus oregoni TaxID=111838 RepID=UPI001BB1B339|nr:syncytin-1-like [Microtus oregoni]XP_041524946.1 syncytin-1-like [Microtus oregoni]XP_041524947.1 syncytin-1-like [Microtus oregoni]
MHARCYSSYSECINNGQSYFTALVTHHWKGNAGGDWSVQPQILGSTNKLSQASCTVPIGKLACWNKNAPIHVSDGGGPTDTVREVQIQEEVQKWIDSQIPQIHYHPLLLPKPRGVEIDPQTFEVLEATHYTLNITNPTLAQDCWMCLAYGSPWPLALPSSFNGTFKSSLENCILMPPFWVQPVAFNMTLCVYKHYQNNSFDIDVGLITFTACSLKYNASSMLCPPTGHVFVCGGNMAYTVLPMNWTGLCVLATLLPDVELLPGNEPVPIPTFDYFSPRHQRAIQFIPLLVGLGVAGTLGTGTAGLATSLSSYTKLSQQLADDITKVYTSVQDLQDQIDSLAEVILQNRRGLDLLTADKGGLCLTLQERCCFYANKSGIVRDRIKHHQEELEQRRCELHNRPIWTAWGGILPYLLPFFGPLLGLLLLISFGPWAFNRLTHFIKSQIDSALKPVEVHYHRLAANEEAANEEVAVIELQKISLPSPQPLSLSHSPLRFHTPSPGPGWKFWTKL